MNYQIGDKVCYRSINSADLLEGRITSVERDRYVIDDLIYVYDYLPDSYNHDNFYITNERVIIKEVENNLPQEFSDYKEILEMGARKYGNLNWLEADGVKSSHKDMHASMFRHLAESSAGLREDLESGMDPLLHLACRALMMYTRIKRNIVHKDDRQ
jgi:hypothetical protein